jgi:hypothetical protein
MPASPTDPRQPIRTPASFFNASTLCAAALMMFATAAPAAAQQADRLQLGYLVNFANGSLEPSANHLGISGPMLTTSSLTASNPTFAPLPGELLIGVTRPAGLQNGVSVGAGVFATPVNFGPGSVSRVSATFRAPIGPSFGGWAVGVQGRTGGQHDLSPETKVVATLRVEPGGELRLNVPLGATEPTFVRLPRRIRNEIFSAASPKPFTLDLTIDRMTGTGRAELTTGNDVFSVSFVLKDFRAHGGPTITAMGAAVGVANNGAAGQPLSVRLREFRIYAPRD